MLLIIPLLPIIITLLKIFASLLLNKLIVSETDTIFCYIAIRKRYKRIEVGAFN